MITTPIKTGADVYLTGEKVVVHCDLFAMFSDGACSLYANYVTPFKFVDAKQDENGEWPEEFDAIFDTEAYPNAVLDMSLARVMVCAPSYSMLSLELVGAVPGFMEEVLSRELTSKISKIFGGAA